MAISDRNKRILYLKSGNKCAIPTCRTNLIVDPIAPRDKISVIGEVAHIRGEKPTSKRHDSSMNEKDRNDYQNLIFLCNTCHKIVDDQDSRYTVEKLHEIKNEHEKWVEDKLTKVMTDMTFSELYIITKYLSANQSKYEEDFKIISPIEKIKKNQLSVNISRQIIMGMTQVKLVSEFIDANPDIEFGERLRDGFVTEYNRLKNEKWLEGDDLFISLLEFATGGITSDMKKISAGLAVLVYLFEKCEVFEK